MITRICISINNRCNLKCEYCHFNEKNINTNEMDIFEILDNVKHYAQSKFKIGFVGNGETFLDWQSLKSYISYIQDYPNISIYTITNGTIRLKDEDWIFLKNHKVKVGFSIDGYKELHDSNRYPKSFDRAMRNVEKYKELIGNYPTFNATVGRESLNNAKKVIDFFKPFQSRITFSRMIGNYGISLEEYHDFLLEAEKSGLEIRRGGKDCTMYGGQCGAGLDNYFFANGKVYYCGNCIDLPPLASSSITFEELEKISLDFNRNYCYKEML